MPDDFIDALNDCSQDADCWAVRTKPERETNSEVCFVPSLLVALHYIYLYMYVYNRVCVRVCRCTLAIRFPVLFACSPWLLHISVCLCGVPCMRERERVCVCVCVCVYVHAYTRAQTRTHELGKRRMLTSELLHMRLLRCICCSACRCSVSTPPSGPRKRKRRRQSKPHANSMRRQKTGRDQHRAGRGRAGGVRGGMLAREGVAGAVACIATNGWSCAVMRHYWGEGRWRRCWQRD